MHFIAFHNEVYLFRILRSSQILSFKRQTEDANQRLPLHDAAMNAHRELSRWLIRQDPSKGSCAAKDAEDQLPVHAVCTRQWLQQHSEADHLAFLDMILPLYPSAWAMQSRRPCSTWFKVQFCFTFVLWCEWIQRFKLRVASREFQKGRTRTSLDELESIVWEEGCISLRCQYCENLRWCARAGAWSKVECAVGQRRPHGIQEVSGETSWGSKRSQYESSHLL